jgi:hypothetical protein
MASATSSAPDDTRRSLAGGHSRFFLARVRSEYLDMPGLTLTPRQAARLCGLPIRDSERLLSTLADEGFLVRDPKGAYRLGGCPRCT